MAISQISRPGALKDTEFTWKLVPLQKGPRGDYAVIGQAGVGMLKRSKNVETAADFLGFLTNEANSAKLAQFVSSVRSSLLRASARVW